MCQSSSAMVNEGCVVTVPVIKMISGSGVSELWLGCRFLTDVYNKNPK